MAAWPLLRGHIWSLLSSRHQCLVTDAVGRPVVEAPSAPPSPPTTSSIVTSPATTSATTGSWSATRTRPTSADSSVDSPPACTTRQQGHDRTRRSRLTPATPPTGPTAGNPTLRPRSHPHGSRTIIHVSVGGDLADGPTAGPELVLAAAGTAYCFPQPPGKMDSYLPGRADRPSRPARQLRSSSTRLS